MSFLKTEFVFFMAEIVKLQITYKFSRKIKMECWNNANFNVPPFHSGEASKVIKITLMDTLFYPGDKEPDDEHDKKRCEPLDT